MPDAAAEREPDEGERAFDLVEDAARRDRRRRATSTSGAPPWPGWSMRTTSSPHERGRLRVPDPRGRRRASRRGRPRSRAAIFERAVDERAGRAEVVLGALGVDAQALRLGERVSGRCSRASARRRPRARRASGAPRRRAAGGRERRRERLPLRVPGTGRALVLVLGERREQRRVRAARAARTRAASTARDGVALVRHRRRSDRRLGLARPRRPRSARAARRRRRSSQRARGSRRARRRAPRIGARSVCHGNARLREVELGREQRAAPPGRRSPKRGERAARRRRAARAAPPRCGEPLPRVDDRDEPAGRLQPERRRHGLLQQRPRGHHRVAVRPGELGAEAADARRARRRSAQDARARRASPPCRGCPGSSRRGGRAPRTRRRPARAARARAARPGSRRRGPSRASCCSS